MFYLVLLFVFSSIYIHFSLSLHFLFYLVLEQSTEVFSFFLKVANMMPFYSTYKKQESRASVEQSPLSFKNLQS